MSKTGKWIFRISLVIIIGLAFYYFSKPKKNERIETNSTPYEVPFKKQGTLQFLTAEGDTIRNMDLEIAETEDERSQGLMYRSSMTDSQAMLFVFKEEKQQNFWMKNTYISLDILFATSDGTIATIHKNTRPYSEDPVPSYVPTQYVIEVVAGFSDLYGLKKGDKFVYNKE